MRPLPNHRLIAVAVKAQTQPNTVRRYLRGEIKRASVVDHIEQALRDLALESYVSKAQSSLPGNKA